MGGSGGQSHQGKQSGFGGLAQSLLGGGSHSSSHGGSYGGGGLVGSVAGALLGSGNKPHGQGYSTAGHSSANNSYFPGASGSNSHGTTVGIAKRSTWPMC